MLVSAYGVKYTAFLTLPFAAGWVCVCRFRRRKSGRSGSLGASCALLVLLRRRWSWLLPGCCATGSGWAIPFAPFFNSWFPNPYYHPGMERIYAETLSHYTGIKHYWEIPLQLTLRSGFDGGVFGPVFLLAPLGLLALRMRSGRRLLLAALVFALPAYLNTGTRFLIPSTPFLALAMGIGLADIPAALPILALFHAFVCWPPVLSTYCDSWNWRISSFPGRVALRLDPVEPFILKNLPDYALKLPVELAVPKGERVFSFAGRPQAYIDRDIIVSYESTLGNLANDILWTPQAYKPRTPSIFTFCRYPLARSA